VTRPHFEWRQVLPGQFFWRMRAVNLAEDHTEYSPASELNVYTATPTLLEKYNFKKGTPLEWAPVPLADKYVVRISPIAKWPA